MTNGIRERRLSFHAASPMASTYVDMTRQMDKKTSDMGHAVIMLVTHCTVKDDSILVANSNARRGQNHHYR